MANTVFYRKVMMDGIERECTFQQTFFGYELMYQIDVNDAIGRISFRMARDENKGRWKIAPQVLPVWIFDCEPALSDIIEEDLQER